MKKLRHIGVKYVTPVSHSKPGAKLKLELGILISVSVLLISPQYTLANYFIFQHFHIFSMSTK